jgi:hypothetical protein
VEKGVAGARQVGRRRGREGRGKRETELPLPRIRKATRILKQGSILD